MSFDTNNLIESNHSQELISPKQNKLAFVDRILRNATKAITSGTIIFKLENGKTIKCESGNKGPEAIINVHSVKFFRRLLSAGYLGLAESYINKEWTTPSLENVFNFGAANLAALDKNLTENLFVRLTNKITRFMQRNSIRGSRKNIANHYDLGNDFFIEWLDATMTYSSALFLKKTDTLQSAQNKKYQRIIDELKIEKSQDILEIGCGWGGFAEYAANKTNANIFGATISKEQCDYARNRITKANLGDNVTISLQDYRTLTGQYDKIVSIEMLEAVGKPYWPVYFKTVADRLKRNGSAMVQVITVPDEYFGYYSNGMDFIQRYIFPGGMLICPKILKEHSEKSGLTLVQAHMFGSSYAQTLEQWQSSFQKRWDKIEKLGFDEKFKRIWEYYLDYTAAGFRSGAIDVGQFHLHKS
jgi:cyclopropane-fatty-acyl-phospholipid synthase